jgi:hypothetical protein
MLHTIQRTLQSGWRKIRTAKVAADGATAPTDLTANGTLSPSLTDYTYRCLIPETANRMSKVILDPKGSSEIAEYWTAMSATTSWASIMTEY